MIRFSFLFIFSFILYTYSLHAQEWPEIKNTSKPGTRWWWMGSAVDEANLSYAINEYATAGLGTLEITPIYGVKGNEANEPDFLSPRWMDLLRHTQAEAHRYGMEINMNTGTGWPFGGPEVTMEDAATKAIFQTYNVSGGKKITLNIEVEDNKQKEAATLSRVMAYGANKKCLNITSDVRDRTLSWEAPSGEWKISVLYTGKTFQKVKRAAPGGEGYVMDHFNRKAVQRYLGKFDTAFRSTSTPYPAGFFNDSYEVYQADWTPGLLEEFYQRRGYRLEEYFPEFLDESRPEKTCRIVSDYRETLSELLVENFTRQWTDWAHTHKSITRNQGHGSPANLIDIYASVDIPECEGFGLSQFNIKGLRQDSITRKNDSDISMLKYASSAAHITGKPYVSSETFTWLTEHFRTSLAQCKPDMDLMFVAGVNRMFFHGTPYSPKEAAWPGWLFYATINMSPTNSIWRDAPAFFQYITRCQSFLQMGKPDADFLIYLPIYDIWNEQPGRLLLFDIHKMESRAPAFIKTIHEINNSGFDVDYISDNYLRNTVCKDGNLVTEGGGNYKAIIIPAVKYMPADVLSHLVLLAQQGATILFMENYPEDIPGFGTLDKRRANFKKAKQQLPPVRDFTSTRVAGLRKGKVITGSEYISALQQTSAEKEEMKSRYGLQYIRRTNKDGHHYFISSLQEKGVDNWVTLGVNATSAMFFNPVSGEKGKAAIRIREGKVQVRIQLLSGESIILQTFNHDVVAEKWNYIRKHPLSLNADHGWKLTFISGTPAIDGSFDMDMPASWTEVDHPDGKVYMGTGLYSLEVDIPDFPADDWLIVLDDLRESARVRINGQEAGTVWAVPYQLKIGKYLRRGRNKIELEVTNLPANRIAEMDRQKIEWRTFKDINMVGLNYEKNTYENWQPVPSGLNGDVKLVPVFYE